jgi:hypothetical protein
MEPPLRRERQRQPARGLAVLPVLGRHLPGRGTLRRMRTDPPKDRPLSRAEQALLAVAIVVAFTGCLWWGGCRHNAFGP